MTHSQDKRKVQTPGHESHGAQICHRCGWAFPNPHPSAKHRRAHKKVCGKMERFKMVESEHKNHSDEDVSDDDHKPSVSMDNNSQSNDQTQHNHIQNADLLKSRSIDLDGGMYIHDQALLSTNVVRPFVSDINGASLVAEPAAGDKESPVETGTCDSVERTNTTFEKVIEAASNLETEGNRKTATTLNLPTVEILSSKSTLDCSETDSKFHVMDGLTEVPFDSTGASIVAMEASSEEMVVDLKEPFSAIFNTQEEKIDTSVKQDTHNEMFSHMDFRDTETGGEEHLDGFVGIAHVPELRRQADSEKDANVDIPSGQVKGCDHHEKMDERTPNVLSTSTNVMIEDLSEMKSEVCKEDEPVQQEISQTYASAKTIGTTVLHVNNPIELEDHLGLMSVASGETVDITKTMQVQDSLQVDKIESKSVGEEFIVNQSGVDRVCKDEGSQFVGLGSGGCAVDTSGWQNCQNELFPTAELRVTENEGVEHMGDFATTSQVTEGSVPAGSKKEVNVENPRDRVEAEDHLGLESFASVEIVDIPSAMLVREDGLQVDKTVSETVNEEFAVDPICLDTEHSAEGSQFVGLGSGGCEVGTSGWKNPQNEVRDKETEVGEHLANFAATSHVSEGSMKTDSKKEVNVENPSGMVEVEDHLGVMSIVSVETMDIPSTMQVTEERFQVDNTVSKITDEELVINQSSIDREHNDEGSQFASGAYVVDTSGWQNSQNVVFPITELRATETEGSKSMGDFDATAQVSGGMPADSRKDVDLDNSSDMVEVEDHLGFLSFASSEAMDIPSTMQVEEDNYEVEMTAIKTSEEEVVVDRSCMDRNHNDEGSQFFWLGSSGCAVDTSGWKISQNEVFPTTELRATESGVEHMVGFAATSQVTEGSFPAGSKKEVNVENPSNMVEAEDHLGLISVASGEIVDIPPIMQLKEDGLHVDLTVNKTMDEDSIVDLCMDRDCNNGGSQFVGLGSSGCAVDASTQQNLWNEVFPTKEVMASETEDGEHMGDSAATPLVSEGSVPADFKKQANVENPSDVIEVEDQLGLMLVALDETVDVPSTMQTKEYGLQEDKTLSMTKEEEFIVDQICTDGNRDDVGSQYVGIASSPFEVVTSERQNSQNELCPTIESRATETEGGEHTGDFAATASISRGSMPADSRIKVDFESPSDISEGCDDRKVDENPAHLSTPVYVMVESISEMKSQVCEKDEPVQQGVSQISSIVDAVRSTEVHVTNPGLILVTSSDTAESPSTTQVQEDSLKVDKTVSNYRNEDLIVDQSCLNCNREGSQFVKVGSVGCALEDLNSDDLEAYPDKTTYGKSAKTNKATAINDLIHFSSTIDAIGNHVEENKLDYYFLDQEHHHGLSCDILPETQVVDAAGSSTANPAAGTVLCQETATVNGAHDTVHEVKDDHTIGVKDHSQEYAGTESEGKQHFQAEFGMYELVVNQLGTAVSSKRMDINTSHPDDSSKLYPEQPKNQDEDSQERIEHGSCVDPLVLKTEQQIGSLREDLKLIRVSGVGLCQSNTHSFIPDDHVSSSSMSLENCSTNFIQGDTSIIQSHSVQEGIDDTIPKRNFNASVLAMDASVDSISQTDSVEGFWGSVSDGIVPSMRDASDTPLISIEAAPNINILTSKEHCTNGTYLFDAPSFMTLVEPSKDAHRVPASEFQSRQEPQCQDYPTKSGWFPSLTNVVNESQGRKKNEEIIAKVVNWSSGKARTPLGHLLVEANLESKRPSLSLAAQKYATRKPNELQALQDNGFQGKTTTKLLTSPATTEVIDKEWNSPARLPVAKRGKRKIWVPFVCCSWVK